MGEVERIDGRALVLGGGGVAGIAWMTGLLLGMEDEGIQLRDAADVLIGTSAGSTVAAQIAGNTSLDDLFQRQIEPARQVAELLPKLYLLELMSHAFPVLFKLTDPIERTRRIGDLAANTTTVDEAVRRAVIAERLPAHKWPDRALKIVVVDIKTGQPRIFDRFSGIGLVDAVAASCAVPGVWPPVSIGDHRYIDGGMRSSDDADFAMDCGSVVVISPIGAEGMTLPGSIGLAAQVEALQQSGSTVIVIEPDDAARNAMGHNPLSPESRAPAAKAGRTQGRTFAAGAKAFVGR